MASIAHEALDLLNVKKADLRVAQALLFEWKSVDGFLVFLVDKLTGELRAEIRRPPGIRPPGAAGS